MFVAREKELERLSQLIDRGKSSFVAIYGRRRVGKTELIRHFCKINTIEKIEFAGKVDHTKKQQIKSFATKIRRVYKEDRKIEDWNDAFYFLMDYLDTLPKDKKIVVFLDELPWFDTQKSGFIGELSEFWNDYCTRKENIILIVCGSAASYMLKKVIHNRGSLHGRLTDILQIKQFDLGATKELLLAHGCRYSDKAIVDTYMVFGGVAKYLESLDCKLLSSQSINQLCFTEDGLLRYEYEELFSSLFKNSKTHYEVMNQLSSKWTGYTQKELSALTKVSSSYLKIPLEELLASGFISKMTKFNQKKRDVLYRATDCFSYFHHKWMESDSHKNWNSVVTTQSYKSWAGYAFENICHMHVSQLKSILGIAGVETQTHYWSHIEKDKSKYGSQIDMLIEHTNGSNNIDIVECKYYKEPFTITKKYKEELIRKIEVFNEQTKHKYNIRLIFITPFGLDKNEYYNELSPLDIKISDILNGVHLI